MLITGLAEAGSKIDQARADHATTRIDHLGRGKLGRCIADRDHEFAIDMQIQLVVDAVRRIDQAAVDDADAHASPPRSACDCIAIDITAMRTAMP